MNNRKIVINKREYAWGDIGVWIAGQYVGGLRAIEYKETKEKEAAYGSGRLPRSIQHGEYAYAGSLTLLQSEIEALERSAQLAGYRSFLDLDIDIVVSYSLDGLVLKTDTIKYASFTENPYSFAQGDKYQEVALPFIALDIQRGTLNPRI